jgi:hypothetical protein
MRNSLFIFKPPNQREDIIAKCRECDKDRDTAPTRLNSVYASVYAQAAIDSLTI